MNETQRRVIEAAVEFRLVYADPNFEGDDELCTAVDELLEGEPMWNPAGVRDHVELERR